MGTQREADVRTISGAIQSEVKKRGAFVMAGVREDEAAAGAMLWLRQHRERGAPMRSVLDEPHGLQSSAGGERRVWDFSESQDDVRIAIDSRGSNGSPNRMSAFEHQGVLIAHTQWPPCRRPRCMPDQSLGDGTFVCGDDDLRIDALTYI